MKFLVQFSRVIIGLLFILSGVIKLNDPTGFSYKLDEYCAVFESDYQVQQDSIFTSIQHPNGAIQYSQALKAGDTGLSILIHSVPLAVDQSDSLTAWHSKINILQNGILIGTDSIRATEDQPLKLTVHSAIRNKTLINEQIDLWTLRDSGITLFVDVRSNIKATDWLADFFAYCGEHTLFLSIFISWLEALLGFALLLGFQSRLTTLALFLMTAFFTYLTYYSWVYNKVTDCGCFGDAMPMSPKESFIKNLVVGIFIIFLVLGAKKIKPVFSNPFGVKVLTILTIILVGFSLYCKHYLPVVDFLHFKEGNNIKALMSVPAGERVSPHVVTTYRYKGSGGATKEFVFDSELNTFSPELDHRQWQFDTLLSSKTLEDAYTPPIHDFAIMDASGVNNYIDSFWVSRVKLLFVLENLATVNKDALARIGEITTYCAENDIVVWALTSSSPADAEQFRHDHQLAELHFHYGDQTQLKSIIRSNPGLLLISDFTFVQKQWPSTRLPSIEKLEKLIK